MIKVSKFARGLVFLVATVVWNAGAQNWCPTPSDRTISCSNCTKILTCDVNGFGLRITGQNVTLDGNWKTISNAPDVGVYVLSVAGSNIFNLNIYHSGTDGISYTGSNQRTYSTLDNVYIWDSGYDGVYHTSLHGLAIYNSALWENGRSGLASSTSTTGGGQEYVDVINSSLYWNVSYGVKINNRKAGSYLWDNSLSFNANSGAYVYNTPMNIERNYIVGNTNRGVELHQSAGSGLVENGGWSNSNYDCYATHGPNFNSGNNWGSFSGHCTP